MTVATICAAPRCANVQPCASHPNRAWRGGGSTAAWRRLRALVLSAEPICRLCKRAPATEVDHIVPRVLGGADSLSNLQPLCGPCNRTKSRSDR